MEYRTPVARARGLGAAHFGSGHWWRQRITALILLPLGFWFLLCFAQLPNAEYQTLRIWFQQPVNSALMLVFTVVALYHAALGVQVVLEDYIHVRWLKFLALALAHLSLAASGLAGVFAILYLLFRP